MLLTFDCRPVCLCEGSECRALLFSVWICWRTVVNLIKVYRSFITCQSLLCCVVKCWKLNFLLALCLSVCLARLSFQLCLSVWLSCCLSVSYIYLTDFLTRPYSLLLPVSYYYPMLSFRNRFSLNIISLFLSLNILFTFSLFLLLETLKKSSSCLVLMALAAD